MPKIFLQAEGADTFYLGKWWMDLYDPNSNQSNTDMFRFSLEGKLGDFGWEAGISTGSSTIYSNQNNQLYEVIYCTGCWGKPDTNRIDCNWNYEADYENGNVSDLGLPTYSGTIFGKRGDCKPYNPFGFGQNSAESLDYVTAAYFDRAS